MSKLKMHRFLIGLACLLIVAHLITYGIDKNQIALDKEPRFCISAGMLKDGGTKLYYGFGYQIIKWNRLSEKLVEGEIKHGISYGCEIHRFPLFVDWTNGPNIDLEFRVSE